MYIAPFLNTVGFLADKFGRHVMIRFGGVCLILASILTGFLVINPTEYTDSFLLKGFMVTQILFGISNAIFLGPTQTLLAESIEKHQRAEWYSKMQLYSIVSSLCVRAYKTNYFDSI